MNIKAKIKSILPKTIIDFLKKYREYSPKNIYKDALTIHNIQQVSRKEKTGKLIKVGFIVQMAEIWDKELPIFDAMLSDSAFEVDMIIVPPYNQVRKEVEHTYQLSNYFITHYSNYVLAYQNGEWISLESRNYDYIFLQRPYDLYLPEGFKSSDIVKFAKVCYIPYGFSGSDVFNPGLLDKRFFRNVYFIFLESEYMKGLLSEKFRFPIEKRFHKIMNKGYPALIPYFSFPPITQYHTFTWTPRWSFDEIIGGSNFLRFKDTFLQIAKDHKECRFIFRPHPLMFGEIEEKGLMTSDEIKQYENSLSQYGITYDKDAPLFDSLKNTDVLITDYSSIIIHFFITGRPIVYCESCIELNRTFQTLREGMYIVKTETDLSSVIDQLIRGEDTQKQLREGIVENLSIFHQDSTNKIVDEIKLDYLRNA